jgi:WD40 repeat protein
MLELRGGKELYSFPGYCEPIHSLAFAPEGDWLATGGGGYWKGPQWEKGDVTIRLWDMALRQDLGRLKGHTDAIGCLAFAPKGRSLLSGSKDGTLRLWDASSRKELAVQPAHEDGVRSLAIAPCGLWALSGGTDSRACLWRLPLSATGTFSGGNLEPIGECRRSDGGGRTPSAHENAVMTVAISPNGRLALTGGRDGRLHLWRVDAPLH